MGWSVINKHLCRKIVGAGLLGVNLVNPVYGAEIDAEELRAELHAIRHDYESRISILENRIEELEAKKEPKSRVTHPSKSSETDH